MKLEIGDVLIERIDPKHSVLIVAKLDDDQNTLFLHFNDDLSRGWEGGDGISIYWGDEGLVDEEVWERQ